MDQPDNTGRNQAGRFTKGRSGNPAGKRRGSRNRASILLDRLAEASAAELLRTVIAKAEQGDITAAGLVLARIWPQRKGRPVRFPLAELNAPGDLPVAIAGLIRAASEGELSPDEVAALAGALDGWRRSVELVEIEARLRQVELEIERSRAATGES
jgi:Family of unknown function (DUF5681)